jgi:hypothetical protein
MKKGDKDFLESEICASSAQKIGYKLPLENLKKFD